MSVHGGRARAGMLAGVLATLLGCASPLPAPHDKPGSTAYGHPERTLLAHRLALPPDSPANASALRLLASGHEAFAARAMLAETAEHTLDLQYHLVESDDTATLLLQRAFRAANRGVRVRVLIDDIATGLPESDLAAMSLHPSVQVRLFNPFRARGSWSRALEWLGSSKRLNRRMHNKLWIADNAAAVIGGRNLGDAYFDTTPNEGFADLDLLVAGPAVREASRSFDAYWASDWSVPLAAVVPPPASAADARRTLEDLDARAEAFRAGDYARTARATEFVRQLRDGQVELIAAQARVHADDPPDREPATPAGEPRPIFSALRQAVTVAERELILVSPYLVPSEHALDVLCGLVGRRIAVRVLTNSLASTDVPAVHAGYARYRPRLLACGVELYELRPVAEPGERGRQRLSSGASLHAKAVVVDRTLVFMGSMNLDPRSRQHNTEVALQVDSPALGSRLGELFDESTTPGQVYRLALERPGDATSALRWHSIEAGSAIVHDDEPLAGWWRRAAAAVLGWVVDEELL